MNSIKIYPSLCKISPIPSSDVIAIPALRYSVFVIKASIVVEPEASIALSLTYFCRCPSDGSRVPVKINYELIYSRKKRQFLKLWRDFSLKTASITSYIAS